MRKALLTGISLAFAFAAMAGALEVRTIDLPNGQRLEATEGGPPAAPTGDGTPLLVATKDGPTAAPEGEILTFVFDVQNVGDGDALNVFIDDTSILADVQAGVIEFYGQGFLVFPSPPYSATITFDSTIGWWATVSHIGPGEHYSVYASYRVLQGGGELSDQATVYMDCTALPCTSPVATLTDDPDTPAGEDPTVVPLVPLLTVIPTLQSWGIVAFAALLGFGALLTIRRRG